MIKKNENETRNKNRKPLPKYKSLNNKVWSNMGGNGSMFSGDCPSMSCITRSCAANNNQGTSVGCG